MRDEPGARSDYDTANEMIATDRAFALGTGILAGAGLVVGVVGALLLHRASAPPRVSAGVLWHPPGWTFRVAF